MKASKFKFLAISIAFATLSACTHRVLDFTVISSKSVDFVSGIKYEKGKNRITGIDLVHWIVIIPTGTINFKQAIDRAIESTPGCVALLDGVIYTKTWYIPYIYGRETAIVEGTPLIDPKTALNNSDMPKYGKIELDKDGKIAKVTSITSSDFSAVKARVLKENQ
jgi:hypothetical protein